MKSNPETDEWLATMRSAWKAGIDRDEREQSAASARQLARAVVPETERPRRQMLREILPLAACLAACALGGIWLRHSLAVPHSIAIHPIRADEGAVIAPAEPAHVENLASPAASTAVSAPVPAASTAPAPAPVLTTKPKSKAEVLPPLPRPTPANNGADESSHARKMRRFQLRIPHRAHRGHVRDL